MVCPVCGIAHAACKGVTSNMTTPVGYGMFGQEAGAAIGSPASPIPTGEDTMAASGYTAQERLYLDKDGKVVRGDNPDRVSLLVAVGGTLSTEDARRYGLIGADGEAIAVEVDQTASKAIDEPPANKAVGKAPANKAAKE